MKTIAIAGALALGLATFANAGPSDHPPPIKCHPPRVARFVTVVVHQYQRRHEWRCVLPGHR